MPQGERLKPEYMYGLPSARLPSPSFANSLSQAYTHHYHSFIAFQQHAMVMSQMLHKMTRSRSQSPDSSLQPFSVPFPPYFNLSPTEDHRLHLPSTFPELDEYSPLSRAQSDQGYCSSMTSDSRSKSSRLSTGSETSEKSRSLRVSPDSIRSKSSRPPSTFDENSKSSDAFGSIQAPEVSSSTFCPVMILDEDSRKSMSKLLPSFCDETSNQGVSDCDIEIKIEPEEPPSPSTSDNYPAQSTRSAEMVADNPDLEIDFARNVKEEVDSPVKFLNSDVMWSVKPNALADSQHGFVPSPDKSSNDCASEFNPPYFGQFGRNRLPHPVQDSAPLVMPFMHCESQRQPKQSKQSKKPSSMKPEATPLSLQTEAMDLTVSKKRKAKSPMKENVKKRQKKDIVMIKASKKQAKREESSSEAMLNEKQLWKRDPVHAKHVLKVIKQPNVKPVVYIQEPTTEVIPPEEVRVKKKQAKQAQDKQEKKYQCSKCDKTYSQRSSLHTHMRIHTGVRPYECKDCGRTFTDCSTYIKHCRLHTGEKPYACGVCGRCFTQSGNMMRHQQKCKIRT